MSATLPTSDHAPPELVATSAFRCAVLVPTYNNPITVRKVVEAARKHVDNVIVVDDGSSSEGRRACEEIAAAGLAHVHHRERNGGKGAAVKTGFAVARELGFTHALQVDADGQHDLQAIPEFLAVGRRDPAAVLLGCPRYDDSAPRHRVVARKITRFWVDLEVGKGVIEDTMIGFRLYPLDIVQHVRIAGDRMDFDVEIAVRLAWIGARIVNMPVGVRYLDEAEGGVSHFQVFWDNVRFTWMHSKLMTIKCSVWCMEKLHIYRRPRLPPANSPGGA
jgi:glycosyltransferase involved in cell wall biosynthesis